MDNIQVQDNQSQEAAAGQAAEVPQETQEQPEVKTFTQDEVNKMIEKRLSRATKDIEAKIIAEKEEAAKLAKMSEAERQKTLFDKQVKEFEETKKAFEKERLLNETSKQLAEKNLPIDFADYLIAEDAESTFNNINKFQDKWNTAIEKALDERLKGKTPAASISANKSALTMDIIKSMSPAEIQARWTEVNQVLSGK